MSVVDVLAQRVISIRTGLVVLVLVALVPAVVLVVVSGLNRKTADEQRAADDSIRLAQLISTQYMETRQSAIQMLSVLATLDSVRDPNRCPSDLAELRQRFPQYVGIAYANAAGMVTCSSTPPTPGMPPGSVAERNYFIQTMAGNTFAEGDFRFNERAQKPTIGFSYPLRDDDGQPVGAVIATLDLTWLNSALSLADIPPNMTVTLFDRNGTVLSRYPDPQNRWVGQSYGDSDLFHRITDGSDRSFEAPGLDSVDRLYAFTELGPGASAALLTVGTPTNLAFAEANAALTRSLRYLFIVALVAAFAAWAFGEVFIIGPVSALARTSRRLASGDLAARSDLEFARGEVGHLQRTFNDMAVALQQRDEEVVEAEGALRHRIAQLNALQGVFSRITEVLSTDEVIASALEQASSLLQSDILVLRLLRDGILEVAGTYTSYETDLDMRPIVPGEGPIAKVAQDAEVVRFERDAEETEKWQGVRAARSGIAVPVLIHGEVLGTFSCWSFQPNAFSDDDQQLIQMFATQIGAAIAAARARDESERMARLDSLTGLPNRLKLTEDSRLLDASESPQSMLVAMVDIDHFKRINDQFGHLFGDVVLRRVASTLQATVGRGDVVYRFGGEEFLVIAACRDIVQAVEIAEALRAAVAGVNFEQRRGHGPLHVTVSAGVGLYDAQADSIDTTIEMADRALYRAKANGRNRVEFAAALHEKAA